MTRKFEVRIIIAEFLIFMSEGKEDGVEVMYADEAIGYRANSRSATQFHQRATCVLKK